MENSRALGWHNFSNELILFHAQLKQFLREPEKELERMKKESLAMKVFIEAVIETPKEIENGKCNCGD